MNMIKLDGDDKAAIEAAWDRLNPHNGVHVNTVGNGSYHDYKEDWTITKAGKNSKNSKSLDDLLAMSDSLVSKSVQMWEMSRDNY